MGEAPRCNLAFPLIMGRRKTVSFMVVMTNKIILELNVKKRAIVTK